MGPCPFPTEAHHSTAHGRIGAKYPGRRGKGERAADRFALPLCTQCHHDFHAAAGAFRDWNQEQRRNWQIAQVEAHRARYERDDSF
jgi:hypothetical protein